MAVTMATGIACKTVHRVRYVNRLQPCHFLRARFDKKITGIVCTGVFLGHALDDAITHVDNVKSHISRLCTHRPELLGQTSPVDSAEKSGSPFIGAQTECGLFEIFEDFSVYAELIDAFSAFVSNITSYNLILSLESDDCPILNNPAKKLSGITIYPSPLGRLDEPTVFIRICANFLQGTKLKMEEQARFIQIASTSGFDGNRLRVIIHALDANGDVWEFRRADATTTEGKWVRLTNEAR